MDEKVPLEPPPDYEAATEKSGQSAPGSRPRGPLPFKLPALDSLKGKRVILASASPRRKQLLAQIGLTDVEIIPSGAPEDFPKSLSPFEYVLRTAESKAMAVYEKEIDSPKGAMSILISADTIVLSPIGSTILEKPRSEKHHIDMLQGLRNAGTHKVYTAVVCMSPRDDAVSPGYRIETHVEETTVRFDSSITDDLILAYVKTREGSQLAGGYGIQGLGAILIDGIDGDFYNVVGLPIKSTLQLIEKVMSPSDEEMELELEEE
ncbi:inosine triphosphate pyrophosphatase-like protein [Elsinoe ampelina]|uniref:Inosine triphosphate pyrophosphatase-like protein n=1 Tax=Elsinoe ampelina TaxID=302913 RepID=A0A6A6FY53_9PEZI|nr:inosine triphosphate pyrophosphatase-like protein [Elsinoe ampelina]